MIKAIGIVILAAVIAACVWWDMRKKEVPEIKQYHFGGQLEKYEEEDEVI